MRSKSEQNNLGECQKVTEMNKIEFFHGKSSIVRTLIALVTSMSFLSGCVEVDEKQTNGIIHDWQFTPLQAGLWDKDHPYLFDGSANAGLVFAPYGIAQRSGVISLSCFNRLKSNYGLQMGWDAEAETNYGVSLGVYSVNNLNCGLCIGVYSISLAENWGLQMGVFNLSQFGGQICGINLAGLKIALMNYYSAGWLDIGLFNDGDDALLQIGVLNHNERALIPWFPLINIGVGKASPGTPSSDTMEQVGSGERDHHDKQTAEQERSGK